MTDGQSKTYIYLEYLEKRSQYDIHLRTFIVFSILPPIPFCFLQ